MCVSVCLGEMRSIRSYENVEKCVWVFVIIVFNVEHKHLYKEHRFTNYVLVIYNKY